MKFNFSNALNLKKILDIFLDKCIDSNINSIDASLSNISTIDCIDINSLAFIDKKNINLISSIENKEIGLLVTNIDQSLLKDRLNYILVTDPRKTILQIVNSFEIKFEEASEPKIAQTSYISKSARISTCVHVGNLVRISDYSVIGKSGFGYQDIDGKYENFLHLGGVVIGDNVEIGACTTIDRGSLMDTKIGSDVKIDNLVHIGHNVCIGNHVLIAAQSSIGGSSKIGNNVKIWMGCKIADGVKIVDNVEVGVGSVVIGDLNVPGKYFGNPARIIEKLN